MRDPEWISLSDAQRGQLVAMWLLAADRNGVIPASPKLIQKLCYLESEPDLQAFISLGFIERDATMTPCERQGDALETETETDFLPSDSLKNESPREKEGRPARRKSAAPRPAASASSAGDRRAEAFAFAGSHLKITVRQNELLQEAFAWADLQGEYRKMDSWLEANPERCPKKQSRFAHNWLARIPSPGGQKSRAKEQTARNVEAAKRFRARLDRMDGEVR